ncbi:MAG: PTS glucitol/sorbitol transporter subunit IIA [Bilifractor sp.]|jgi:PTS system glucitol/sorbitol-specific IIA component
MAVIYENKVNAIGAGIAEFEDADYLIIFGDQAPDELKDYCYSVDVNPISGTISPGQTLHFDDQTYTITSVGNEVPITLGGLGHCTVRFSGNTVPELPGTLYVEKKPLPKISVGTVIRITD